MMKLNLLHFLAVGGAVAAAWVMRREARGRSVTPGRLFLGPASALATAFLLLALTAFEWRQPSLWLAALGAGLVLGLLRGLLASLQVDRLWDRLHLGRARDGLWAGYLLSVIAVAALVVDATDLAATGKLDLACNVAAAVCAGFLMGRAGMLWLRYLSAPHANFRSL